MRALFIGIMFFAFHAVSAQLGLRSYGGAYGISLGDQSVALSGVQAAWINPSAVVQAPISVGLVAENRFIDTEIRQIGVTGILPLNDNSGVGLTIRQVSISSFRSQEAQLAYGRRLFDRIRIGASLIARQTQIETYGTITQFNAAIGAQATLTDDIMIGLTVRDLFTQEIVEGEEIAPQFIVGASIKAGATATIYTELEKAINRPAEIRFGVAYRPTEPLFFNIGYNASIQSVHWGLGYRYKKINVAIASSYDFQLGLSPAISISYF